jgi:hypothetical protein
MPEAVKLPRYVLPTPVWAILAYAVPSDSPGFTQSVGNESAFNMEQGSFIEGSKAIFYNLNTVKYLN